MTSLYRCSSAISSRRICPTTARRYSNRPTERENVKGVVRSSSSAYRTQSTTSALFANEVDILAGSRISDAATMDAIILKQRPSEASSNNRSSWEFAMASALAVATTAGLIYLFPAQPPTFSQRSRGSDPDSGGGGFGSGGEGQYATMAFAAAFDQGPDAVHFESQPTEKLATYPLKEKSNDKPYNISVRAIKGGRVTMEDEYFIAEGGRFVAVFDGHGGGGVSQFLKNHLYDAICHHLKEKHWEENDAIHHPSVKVNNTECSNDNSKSVVPSVFSHVAALKAAFSQVEETVMADDTLSYQGSTAVAVLVHESEEGHRTLLSANVGDSRAILSRRGHAVDLTRDHKPNEEREKARILAMGETIEWDRLSKVHRVRNLSLSRAIGDRYAKPVVSGEVEINHYPVVEDGDEFILLASDGLWDVMTSEDAVSFVHQRIESELASENIAKDDIENYKLVLRRNMAKFVAREAIVRGSCDNICVLIVWLNGSDTAK